MFETEQERNRQLEAELKKFEISAEKWNRELDDLTTILETHISKFKEVFR